MKEAIGGTWLFQIVIVFILLFAGYMCLSINHSKAFSIKSEIIESLSRHGEVDKEEISDILHKAEAVEAETSDLGITVGDCNISREPALCGVCILEHHRVDGNGLFLFGLFRNDGLLALTVVNGN